MATRQFTGLDPERIRGRLGEVQEEAGEGVEILTATKYVPVEEMGALEQAGIRLVGENRLQDLEAKRERWGDAFTWDFIGNIQSRKLKSIIPLVRLVHSLASESALAKLDSLPPDTAVLVEVNLSGEESKGGVEPEALGDFIARCPAQVEGLMTMPPFAEDPEQSRPHFARLAEMGGEHGLERLSMGTSQDWRVAVEEGATIIRLGSTLFE